MLSRNCVADEAKSTQAILNDSWRSPPLPSIISYASCFLGRVPERRLEILRSVSPLFRPARSLSSPIKSPPSLFFPLSLSTLLSLSLSFLLFFNLNCRTLDEFLSQPVTRSHEWSKSWSVYFVCTCEHMRVTWRTEDSA